mmetsp:Transcript_50122/g.118578  ORF Transcript_50122/g.118578 Transcript_50122/m.118578 type:complete len:214 (+) Transcript_50122:1681-2322(+)
MVSMVSFAILKSGSGVHPMNAPCCDGWRQKRYPRWVRSLRSTSRGCTSSPNVTLWFRASTTFRSSPSPSSNLASAPNTPARHSTNGVPPPASRATGRLRSTPSFTSDASTAAAACPSAAAHDCPSRGRTFTARTVAPSPSRFPSSHRRDCAVGAQPPSDPPPGAAGSSGPISSGTPPPSPDRSSSICGRTKKCPPNFSHSTPTCAPASKREPP